MRKLLCVFAAPALLAGCISAQVNREALFPARTFELVPEDLGLAPETFTVDGGGATIHAWYFPAPCSDCTIVVCGGNTGNKQHLLPAAQAGVKAGYNTVLFDYRGFGLSTGDPDLWSLVPDTVAVLRAVRARPGCRKVALFGVSLGSMVAVGAASVSPELVDAIVVEGLFDPSLQVRKRVGPVAGAVAQLALIPRSWNMERHVKDLPQPMLLLHGEKDKELPFAESVELYESAGDSGAPRYAWVAPGAGHAPGLAARYGPDYTLLVTRFLDTCLRGARHPWFRTAWDGGRVTLEPVFPMTEAAPVEVVAVSRRGKPTIARRWAGPGEPSGFEMALRHKPVFASTVVATGEVRREGDSWTRSSPYVLSYADWRAFDDSLAVLDRKLREAKPSRPADVRFAPGAHAAAADAERELERLLAGPVDPDVLPRYAADARRIADTYAAVGDAEGAARLRKRAFALLPPDPDAWVAFGDGAWSLGFRSSEVADLFDRLAVHDPAYAPQAAEWREKAAKRKAWLAEWLERNRLPGCSK